VRRRLPGEAAFTFVGATGAKTFDDATIPEGISQVEYTVQAVRSDLNGPVSDIFVINFGLGGSPPSVTSRAGSTTDGMSAADAGVSTVNGQPVRKTLPNLSGNKASA